MARGLLVENAATNILPDTVGLTTGWTNNGGVATRTSGQSLLASTYGVLLTMGSAGGSISRVDATALPSTTMVASVYWKKNTSAAACRFIFRNSNDSTTYADCNWTETSPGVLSFATTAGTCAYRYLGGGVYRIYGTSSAVVTANGMALYLLDNGVPPLNSEWGLPQVEPGSVPSSPIPNSGAGAVSRGVDAWSLAGPSWVVGNGSAVIVERHRWLQGAASGLLDLSQVNISGLDWIRGQWDATNLRFNQYYPNLVAASTPGAQPTLAQLLGDAVGAVTTDYSGTHQMRARGAQVTSGGSGGGSNTSNTFHTGAAPVRRILWGTRIYDALIALPSNAALDAAASAYPGGAIGGYDFANGLPAGGSFTRSTTALNDDLSVAAVNTPRFVAGDF